METETVRATNRFGEVAARAFVAGTMVAEATIKFMMVDAEQE
jgi:3-hydroxymyristoyl/3-hydroxydecanoyl-(acyl carrier protein) dehydratase